MIITILLSILLPSVSGHGYMPYGWGWNPMMRQQPMTKVEQCLVYERPCRLSTGQWFSEGDTCFFVGEDAKKSDEAASACKAQTIDAHLAIINNPLQNRAIAAALRAFGIESAIFGYHYQEKDQIYAYGGMMRDV
ncbi:uncharacterized protein LOC141908518 [Tubulanus polymorphus]|uniref:uncharacterized protein LOC141908518 n=1 Tax=Tubulanus polymorphus TaxID=672921 RepID=UPI003DA6823D